MQLVTPAKSIDTLVGAVRPLGVVRGSRPYLAVHVLPSGLHALLLNTSVVTDVPPASLKVITGVVPVFIFRLNNTETVIVPLPKLPVTLLVLLSVTVKLVTVGSWVVRNPAVVACAGSRI